MSLADEFEAFYRDVVAQGYTTGDPELMARVGDFEAQAIGFGFRDESARDHASIFGDAAGFADAMQRFRSGLEHYSAEVHEMHEISHGNIVVAWGRFTEHFQHPGLAPEIARVRFSVVAEKTDDGWRELFYHREIQPFDRDGRYSRSLTAAEPVA